jgi:hypothetical protein
MNTQREYVEGCQQWYREADLQPGNPEDGVWEECHYPAPRCLGGTETVLLLKEHHAVQGVLQSEEYQHPCIWGWERRYLTGEYLEKFYYWKSNLSRYAQSCMTTEALRNGYEGMVKSLTPEQRRAAIVKATQSNLESNPNHFGDIGRKARDSESYEVKRARMSACHKPEIHARALAKTNGRKFKCRVTGKISTAGPLTRYQNARGIDPTLRDQVQGDP